MAASQSRTVHSKTHRVCPIPTRNIGLIGPLSSTIPSPWIESLHKGRSHMPCMIQRATVPGIWLRPNHIRNIPRPTGSLLSTQEILDPSIHYPVLYHHLESSTYPKAGLICLAWFMQLLCQENGCVPITYGTFQDPQGLSYPHKKYWTHRSIIQYYTITLNRVLTQRQVSYAMRDSKSYGTRKMAASQSRTVHSKTHRVCPIHTRNIGSIGPIASTIPSPWIGSLRKGTSVMPCMIQRAIVPEKWLLPYHVRCIPKPTLSVLSTQVILDPWVHYLVLYLHLESSPYTKAGLLCHARFKELLYQENGCIPITYGTFQDPQGLSYPHKKYWIHRSNRQYYTITLNWVLTQRQVSYSHTGISSAKSMATTPGPDRRFQMSGHCAQVQVKNKTVVQTPWNVQNCNGSHYGTSRECSAYITEKELFRSKQTHCTLPAAREQAGQTATTEPAASSFAQVLAHSQADLVNCNLALSYENARLKEVIITLHQACVRIRISQGLPNLSQNWDHTLWRILPRGRSNWWRSGCDMFLTED